VLRVVVACGFLWASTGCGCGDDDASPGRDAGADATGDGDADADADGDADADADADAGGDAGADAGSAPDPSDAVFAQGVLHEVELEIDPALFAQLDADHESRVPATLTYDGIRLDDVGIREKCGIGSCTTIADKAGFSIKFDALVADQELLGLRKLVLNNSIQDTSYSNELIGQELARRAGIPYKRVAHASVTLNGEPYGLFVVVEAVDKRFLARHFGAGEVEGNLYEGECCGDFVWDPFFPELKDEVEEDRSRDDIIALADFVATTDDEGFVAGVDARIDLPGYLTGYAISALTFHWDGYEYNTNNYYMLDRPSDGRFVFWLHGMDQLFYDCGWSIDAVGRGRLGQRVLENPVLQGSFRAEVARVLDEVWDAPELVALVDAARAIYEDAGRADPRHPLDENRLRDVRHCLIDRPDAVRAQLAAVCGDGVLEAGEQCDDGGVEARDGCSPTCRSECGNGLVDGGEECDDGNPWDGDGCSALCTFEPGCGDGIVQGGMLEDCDDGANGDSFSDGCRDDCSANLCGDGRLDAGEECDDGGLVAGDGCDPGCADEDGAAACGNGVLEAGEECDDGGLVDGDACDSTCARPCAGGDAALVWGANQHCYLLFWAGLDWWSAEADCEARAGHLVTVGRDGENRMLARLGGGWLGLSDEAEEGSFAWVTGEPYEFDGFRPGEPNDWGGNEDCGVLEGIGWNDLDCAAAVGYFCEIE
jgi:cysteine-rich repeat protein